MAHAPWSRHSQEWLNLIRAGIERNHWRDPDATTVNFEKYALRWMEERGLPPTTGYARCAAQPWRSTAVGLVVGDHADRSAYR
ncbi:hypothetical protein ACH40E_06540 [Streptomyces acidicola]|uniref:hypothetical protein n=1 Tax=Streptomyces acidicola TaxID=2596892 RepID=UPI00379C0503